MTLDMTELMGLVIRGSGSEVDPAQAIAFLSRHVIDHSASTCACSPKVVDPLEHLAEVALLALNVPDRPEPKTPVQWRHRARRMGGFTGGAMNRIDQLLDLEYSNTQIAHLLFISPAAVGRRRREWNRINQLIEEAAA